MKYVGQTDTTETQDWTLHVSTDSHFCISIDESSPLWCIDLVSSLCLCMSVHLYCTLQLEY